MCPAPSMRSTSAPRAAAYIASPPRGLYGSASLQAIRIERGSSPGPRGRPPRPSGSRPPPPGCSRGRAARPAGAGRRARTRGRVGGEAHPQQARRASCRSRRAPGRRRSGAATVERLGPLGVARLVLEREPGVSRALPAAAQRVGELVLPVLRQPVMGEPVEQEEGAVGHVAQQRPRPPPAAAGDRRPRPGPPPRRPGLAERAARVAPVPDRVPGRDRVARSCSAMYSAWRMASATMVSVGFAAAPVVNWLASETNRFGTSWAWPNALTTPSCGRSLIRAVPRLCVAG